MSFHYFDGLSVLCEILSHYFSHLDLDSPKHYRHEQWSISDMNLEYGSMVGLLGKSPRLADRTSGRMESRRRHRIKGISTAVRCRYAR